MDLQSIFQPFYSDDNHSNEYSPNGRYSTQDNSKSNYYRNEPITQRSSEEHSPLSNETKVSEQLPSHQLIQSRKSQESNSQAPGISTTVTDGQIIHNQQLQGGGVVASLNPPPKQRGRKKEAPKPKPVWDATMDQMLMKTVRNCKKNWKKAAKKFENGAYPPHFLKKKFREISSRIPTKGALFTEIEDMMIVKYYKKFDLDWEKIAESFTNRNSIMLKNRFYSHIRKKNLIDCTAEKIQQLEKSGELIEVIYLKELKKNQESPSEPDLDDNLQDDSEENDQPTNTQQYITSSSKLEYNSNDNGQGVVPENISPYHKKNSGPHQQYNNDQASSTLKDSTMAFYNRPSFNDGNGPNTQSGNGGGGILEEHNMHFSRQNSSLSAGNVYQGQNNLQLYKSYSSNASSVNSSSHTVGNGSSYNENIHPTNINEFPQSTYPKNSNNNNNQTSSSVPHHQHISEETGPINPYYIKNEQSYSYNIPSSHHQQTRNNLQHQRHSHEPNHSSQVFMKYEDDEQTNHESHGADSDHQSPHAMNIARTIAIHQPANMNINQAQDNHLFFENPLGNGHDNHHNHNHHHHHQHHHHHDHDIHAHHDQTHHQHIPFDGSLGSPNGNDLFDFSIDDEGLGSYNLFIK